MTYLSKYGKRRMFQGGGEMPADPAMAAPAAPAPGGPEQGGPDEVLALAQAAAAGDQEAAAQLGMMLAPMILQEAQAQGGAPAEAGPAPAAEPVFRRGGQFLGTK